MKYLVTFADGRIGRNRNVEPLTVDVGEDGAPDMRAPAIANAVYYYARPKLLSRDVDVSVDSDGSGGHISIGFHNGGTFTIEPVKEA